MTPRSPHFSHLSIIFLSSFAGSRSIGRSSYRRSSKQLSKRKLSHKFCECELRQRDRDAQPRLWAGAQWGGRTINSSSSETVFLEIISLLIEAHIQKYQNIINFRVLTATWVWWIPLQALAPSSAVAAAQHSCSSSLSRRWRPAASSAPP